MLVNKAETSKEDQLLFSTNSYSPEVVTKALAVLDKRWSYPCVPLEDFGQEFG